MQLLHSIESAMNSGKGSERKCKINWENHSNGERVTIFVLSVLKIFESNLFLVILGPDELHEGCHDEGKKDTKSLEAHYLLGGYPLSVQN
jgi:hypothetical protein